MVARVALKLHVEPFGAARTRTVARPTGQFKNGREIWRGGVRPDPKYEAWRKNAMPCFRRAAPATPLLGPLEVLLVAVVPFREGRRRKTTMPPRIWHATRPDLDNLLKAVLDCAQEAGWFLNDWQVVRAVAEKCEAAQGEGPSISVVVRPIETPYHLR
jgi:Holliday junction resolvase RusA-like endonuclease